MKVFARQPTGCPYLNPQRIKIEQLAATNEELEADLRKMALDYLAAQGQDAAQYFARTTLAELKGDTNE